MGNSRSSRRTINEKNVWLAKEVEKKRNDLAKEFVKERIQKDAEFAKDVLKAVGEYLPEEFKKLAEETVAREASAVGKENYQKAIGTIAENLAAEIDSDFLTSDAVKAEIKEACEKSVNADSIAEADKLILEKLAQETKDCALDDPPVWEVK